MQAVFNFITSIFTKSSSSLPYFACHDVVALIVIQPFAIGQPSHVKFRCLSIFLILLFVFSHLPSLSVVFLFTLSRNSGLAPLHIEAPTF